MQRINEIYFNGNHKRMMLLYFGSLQFNGATAEEKKLIRSMFHYSYGVQGKEYIEVTHGISFIQNGSSIGANMS